MTSTRRTRGYLLMEAMVGGAMAGVVLMGMLSLVAVSRAKNVAAARDITANQLVTEAVEQARAGSYPPTASGPTPLTVAGGVYARTVAVSGAACPETRPNPGGGTITMPCVDVTVTVTYTNLTNTRTAQASTRIYQ